MSVIKLNGKGNPMPGTVVSRNSRYYVVVKSDKPTFTGKDAFGLVDLDTGVYNNLDVSLTTLREILDCTGLKVEAYSVEDWYSRRFEGQVKPKKRGEV